MIRPARNVVISIALTLACLSLAQMRALAGPPFLTDDPQPLDYKNTEAYMFGTFDRTADGHARTGPALEYNFGALPNVHVHFVVPMAGYTPSSGSATSGLGDMEVGVKFRFVQETAGRPMIGVFPMAELATGDSARNLGNGRTWYRLPLWVQKSYGPWTTYGGGGWALNNAPGQTNYGFAGWLVQRDIGPHLTLGGELFTQGPTTVGGQHATFYNAGGYLKPTDQFNILFSLGHTISGENHAIGYFGLYWTWGPKGKG